MNDLSKLTDEELCSQAMSMEWPESVEHYLTENGWLLFHDLGANMWWKRPDVTEGLTLGEAFDVQLARVTKAASR